MTTRYGLLVAWVLSACSGVADLPVAAPHAREVEISKSDPPPGSVEIGPIEATHGSDCGAFTTTVTTGTLEGAMLLLRNEAVRRGANYVTLLSAGREHCQDLTVRGIAYQIPSGDMRPVARPTESAPSDVSACAPPCSPGYRCVTQQCVAICNPACGAGQVCRQDRTCSALPPAASGTPAPRP
jgi:hypothetical protein